MLLYLTPYENRYNLSFILNKKLVMKTFTMVISESGASSPTLLFNYGSTQRPSSLIRLINSVTPFSSGTRLISSRPRYKAI